MKHVRLYIKWRPLFLIELQDIACLKSPEDVVNKCKSRLKKKRELKETMLYDSVEDGDNATLATNKHSQEQRKPQGIRD